MTETCVFERVAVEAGGIRIPACPQCGTPNVLSHGIERATFAKCAGDDCGAWIAYDVRITAVACDDRESAKYRFETYIHDDE